MGWASGSEILVGFARRLRKTKVSARVADVVYEILVEQLANADCDTLYEARGVDPVLDVVLDRLYPSDDEGDEDGEE